MSITRHYLHLASKQLAYILILIATMLMLFVGTVYWLSHAVEQRQAEIAHWVSNKTGYPVEIGTVGLHWTGLIPELQLEAVTVLRKDKRAQLLSLDTLYLGLDTIASVQQSQLVLNDITLNGLHIAVMRDQFGQLQLQGLDIQTQSSEVVDWLAWTAILNRFHLKDIRVDYSDQKDRSLAGRYELDSVIITHRSSQWTMTGQVRLPQSLGQKAQFTGEATVDNDNVQMSQWQWRAVIEGLKLEPLTSHLVWQDVAIQRGNVDANLSANGVGYRIDSVKAELDLSQSKLMSKQQDIVHPPVSIERLIGQFDWQQQGQTWQLTGHDIQLHMNGDIWPQTSFTINKQADNSWLLAGKYLRLSDLSAIASLSEYSPEILRQQQPAGDLELFNLRFSPEEGIEGLAFSLSDGALLPWKNYPGVTGLSVTVNWENNSGRMNLNSHQMTLYPEIWLEDAVFFDSVSGTLKLQRNEQSWVVDSDELRLWNDDLALQLDGNVIQNKNGKTVTDLTLALEEVIASHWKSYVPQNLLSDAFKAWSNKAFVAGKIVDGIIELKGDLADFPFESSPEKGHFKMALQVENVQLHYAPDWPDLFGVNGSITGTGNDLIIKSQHGKIADFGFAEVTTTITDLVNPKPVLRVEGALNGTTDVALQFLQTSPLKQRFGNVVKAVKGGGKSDIILNLTLPLTDIDATEVSGQISLVDSQIFKESIPDIGLKQINGLLQFTNRGVTASDIQAQFLATPVTINVKPHGDVTVASMEGEFSTTQINAVWPNKIPEYISGQTPYQLNVSISEKEIGEFYVDTTISSDLFGLNLALPEPFTKAHDKKSQFTATIKHTGEAWSYAFKYGELWNAVVMPVNENWRGELRFGSGEAKLPNHGIRVRGQLAQLSIDDWLAWSSQQKSATNQVAGSIDDVSVTIGKLTGFNQQLTALNVSAQKDAQGWRTTIHSDQTKGSIYIPDSFNNETTLKIDLDKVQLLLPESDTEKMDSEPSVASLWPAVDMNIGSMTINTMALGKLHVRAHREELTWLLDSASLDSALYTASMPAGSWRQSSTGQQSHFKLKVHSDDLGALLTHFGYQQAIDAENVAMTLDFSWPDNPLEVTKENIQGELSLDVGKGQLKDIEPGAAGRVFGLLSVASIPRRLALDFRDLFGKGFSFDSITGNFDLANGHAVTNNFILKGPAANIEMKGDVDLLNQQYDQQVKVTPNVSSSLPVAGAVAGGPIGLGVGTAILLVDKLADRLFDKNIVNLISYNYTLTGPWDDPQLNVVKPVTQ